MAVDPHTSLADRVEARKRRDDNRSTIDEDREGTGPTSNPATNLLIADAAMRAGSHLLRNLIERNLLKGRFGKQTARQIVKKKSLGQTIASVAVAKIATRSVPGAIIIGGGAVAKVLFDRSQKRRSARRAGDTKLHSRADEEPSEG